MQATVAQLEIDAIDAEIERLDLLQDEKRARSNKVSQQVQAGVVELTEETRRLGEANCRLRSALEAAVAALGLATAQLKRYEADDTATSLVADLEKARRRCSVHLDEAAPATPVEAHGGGDLGRIVPGSEVEALRALFPQNSITTRKANYYIIGPPAHDLSAPSLAVRCINGKLLVKVGGGFATLESYVRSHGGAGGGSRRRGVDLEQDLSAFVGQEKVFAAPPWLKSTSKVAAGDTSGWLDDDGTDAVDGDHSGAQAIQQHQLPFGTRYRHDSLVIQHKTSWNKPKRASYCTTCRTPSHKLRGGSAEYVYGKGIVSAIHL